VGNQPYLQLPCSLAINGGAMPLEFCPKCSQEASDARWGLIDLCESI
jgi:hypothetical protein